ncbi:hypothetical protein NL676_034786 [Syzygium grande]|nr:hypothetical protein NL676_034786 [Syzygium grande]
MGANLESSWPFSALQNPRELLGSAKPPTSSSGRLPDAATSPAITPCRHDRRRLTPPQPQLSFSLATTAPAFSLSPSVPLPPRRHCSCSPLLPSLSSSPLLLAVPPSQPARPACLVVAGLPKSQPSLLPTRPGRLPTAWCLACPS